jgi:hypothetical protein
MSSFSSSQPFSSHLSHSLSSSSATRASSASLPAFSPSSSPRIPSSRPSTFASTARDSAGTAASSAAPTRSSSSKPAASLVLPAPALRGFSPPAVGAPKPTPHSSRAATAVPTMHLKFMAARAASLGYLGAPAPPHPPLCPLAASIGHRRATKMLQNEPKAGCAEPGSRLSTTPPAQKLCRGTYPRMRRRLGGFAAA